MASQPSRRSRTQESAPQPVEGGWPPGISTDPTMKIGDVLAALRLDFPAITISKLRYFDSLGLLTPRRSPNGYRKYSARDVERLRYVLREQNNRYTPLKVIAEQLADLDAGLTVQSPTPTRLVTSDGVAATGQRRHYDTASLARQVGCRPEFITSLVDAGLLRQQDGRFDPWALDIAAAAVTLTDNGIDVRHLRTLRHAADREVDLVDQVVAPLRSKRDPAARDFADQRANELGEVLLRLHTALVRSGIAALR
jgi:DNA-binding transcriptional MerR regulator